MKLIIRISGIFLVAVFLYWSFDLTKNKVNYTEDSAWAEYESSPFIFSRVLGGYVIDKLKPLNCRTKPDTELGETILDLINADQEARADGLSEEDAQRSEAETDIFLKETILLDKDFDPCRLGKLRADNIFFFVQHTNNEEIRSQALPILRQWADQGFLAKVNLASAIDRQLVTRGEKQLYGTDFDCDATLKKAVAKNLEKPQLLNERLKEAGLPPFHIIGRWANTMVCGENHHH